MMNSVLLGRCSIHFQFTGQETGIGKARDLSKITHPVKVRTRIQAVPAPGGTCGAPRQGAISGIGSTAEQDGAVERKEREGLVKSQEGNRTQKADRQP